MPFNCASQNLSSDVCNCYSRSGGISGPVREKELERLLGHLSHAAIVIRSGRIFLRKLFGLLPQAPRPHHFARLNEKVRADLSWWRHFLQSWNGVAFFPATKNIVDVYSDASGSFGCGAYESNSGWFQLLWPASWSDIEISAEEMIPVVAAAATWGRHWAGRRVVFHVDNMAVVKVVQRQAPKDLLLTHLSRCLCFYAAMYHFDFTAMHIAGSDNIAADALSRNNLLLFFEQFPQVTHTPVPHMVESLLLHHPPDWTSQSWINTFVSSLTEGSLHQQPHPIAQESGFLLYLSADPVST